MKICMIGLGSIGSRHLNNLAEQLTKEKIPYQIDCLRHTKNSEKPPYIQNTYYNITDLPNDYDVVFITNPTNMHFETLKQVQEKSIHFFIEKPLFSDKDSSIISFSFMSRQICYVACPLRHTSIMDYIKTVCVKESVYAARAICSSYLPNWRKNTDYRKSYSSQRTLGGGTSLDLIHEWDYLTFLFGFPNKVYQLSQKVSDLEINSDDISVYIANYKDKIVEVHLDYFGRKTVRTLELYCKDYVIYADFIANTIRYAGEKNEVIQLEKQDMYKREMAYFLKLIQGNENNMNDIYHAYKVLGLAIGGN